MKISAVIACYRDAPAVPIMHERLVKMFTEIGADYEIIFVNDGSPDNAREVLAELAGARPASRRHQPCAGIRLAERVHLRDANRDRGRRWSCSTVICRIRPS